MNTDKHEWYCPKCQAYLVGEQVTYEETHSTCGTGVVSVPMTHTDKQPQTVYVRCSQTERNDASLIFPLTHDKSFLNGMPFPVKEIPNVYLITPEELEALKVEWQREAASMAFRAGRSYQGMKDHYPNLTEYLNEKYPLPQPPKQ